MTAHIHTTAPRRLTISGLSGLALAATLALTGCSGGASTTDPASKGSASPGASTSPTAPALKDRSAEVMAALSKPVVIASAKATSDDSNVRGSTLQVLSLVRTDTSTVLTISLISTEPSTRLLPGLWDGYPVLTTPAAAYPPVTWLKEPGSHSPWFAVHNPSMWPKAGVAAPPQTILYPPLPPDVTSVTLKGTSFEDVVVPVTTGP